MKEIQELIKILKDEKEIYDKILKLANKKTEFISTENTEEISELSKEEEQYIKEAKILEYKREDLISAIEKTLGIEKVEDISNLLTHIEDEKTKEELIKTKDEFSQTLGELKRVNSLNNILIKDALEYISLSLNLMSGATAEGTYGKSTGDVEPQTQHKSMFDFKG